ncbi:MAG: hypothetical protein PVJ27_09445 [Candidatus Brocadiaceae bacterium]|jgi:hypothetical protein
MKLFIGPNCPQCEALKKRVDLEQVPDLEVHLIPGSGVPANDDEATPLSEADYQDIYSVPALVTDGQTVHDVFDILDELRGAIAGGSTCQTSKQPR